jgi:hypothetical protein
MPDRIEEPAHWEIALFASIDIFNAEVVEEVAIALAFCCDGVPEYRLWGCMRCGK